MSATMIAPRTMLEVGDLARAGGVSTQTIRRWASESLISAPVLTGTGRRLWGADVLTQIERLREERRAARAAGRELATA